MKIKKKSRLNLLVVGAMFAAMTTVLTYFIKIPTQTGGYIHLGDTVIYLCACILPTPYALLAAGIGGACADLFGGYFHYILPTFIIKALISIPLSSKSDRFLTKRNLLGLIPSSVITVGGYYLTQVVMLVIDKLSAKSFFEALTDPTVWGGAIGSIPGDTVQALASAVMFIVFSFAFDKLDLKRKLSLT